MWRETYDENMVELVTHIFGINEEAKELGEELYTEQQLRFKALEAGSTNITIALVQRTTINTIVKEERMFTVNIE